jgi:integrase
MNGIVVVPSFTDTMESVISTTLTTIAPGSRVSYEAAIREYLQWATLEKHPGPFASVSAFSRYLVEVRGLSFGTANQKLSAIRTFYRTAANMGAISEADFRAVREVKNIRRQGQKYGNWLTWEQAKALLSQPDPLILKGRRDIAILAVFMGCGLRRSEVCNLTWDHLVQQGDTWLIRNLIGKHNRVRTVPLPKWVKDAIDLYRPEQGEPTAHIFVSIDRHGHEREAITPHALWLIIAEYATKAGIAECAPHDLRRSFATLARSNGAELEELQAILGHQSVATTQQYLKTVLDYERASHFVDPMAQGESK